MDKINLSENPRRSVSASIFMVEKVVVELENILKFQDERTMSKVVNNIDGFNLQHYTKAISEIKGYIRKLADKYDLHPTDVHLNQIINSSTSSMQVILDDTTSKRLKGYGEFPKEYAQEFDADIEELQKLIEKI